MSPLTFFQAPSPISLAAAAAEVGAHLGDDTDPSRTIRALAPLARAEADDLSAFFDGLAVDDLVETRAGACLIAPRHLELVPPRTCALVTDHPRDAWRRLAAMLHAASLGPGTLFGNAGIDPSAKVSPTARIEAGVLVDPAAIIGPDVEIGAGTFIGAGCVVGAGVRIGRECAVDTAVTLSHALIGDRVVIHAGARLGQADPATGARRRDPQLGRVIVQNDVEIGANAVVARGAFADTVIGEGARVGPLVSIPADALVDRGAIVTNRP